MSSGQHREQQGLQGDIHQLRQGVGETAEELAHRLDVPTRARAGTQQAMDNTRETAQQALGNARATAATIPPSRWAAVAAAAFAVAAAAVARKEARKS